MLNLIWCFIITVLCRFIEQRVYVRVCCCTQFKLVIWCICALQWSQRIHLVIFLFLLFTVFFFYFCCALCHCRRRGTKHRMVECRYVEYHQWYQSSGDVWLLRTNQRIYAIFLLILIWYFTAFLFLIYEGPGFLIYFLSYYLFACSHLNLILRWNKMWDKRIWTWKRKQTNKKCVCQFLLYYQFVFLSLLSYFNIWTIFNETSNNFIGQQSMQ